MKYFFLFVILLISYVYVKDIHECPNIYDGLTNEKIDIDYQFSTTTLSCNWSNNNNDDIIRYEYAIISSNKLQINDVQCRRLPGFIGIADIKGWTDNKKINHVTVTDLDLTVGETYYFVIRTLFNDGKQLFTNSNGVTINEQPEIIREIPLREEENSLSRNNKVERNHIEFSQADCPIDADNRCRQSQIPVHERLNEIYGKPVFNSESQQAFLFYLPLTGADAAAVGVAPGNAIEEGGIEEAVNDDDDDSDDDDDDDDGPPGWIAAIVVAAVILLILLMLCCVALILLFGVLLGKGGEDRFNERIVERDVEDVDAEFGARTERTVESDTRVEFPDIDPHSRLSTFN